jgi:hypothetical protein
MWKPLRRAAVALAALSLAATLFAQDFTGAVRVVVRPGHDDWTYKLGEPARFRISVLRDNVPLPGARVSYQLGPEMLPPTSRRARRSRGPASTSPAGRSSSLASCA